MADQDDLNPGFEEVLEETARLATAKMHVGCMAVVVNYDHTKQQCSCQPVVRGSRKDAPGFRYPVLVRVPVRFPTGGRYSISWPLSKGDFVWLDFGDRSMDEWLEYGKSDVEPQDKRRFHIGDATAFPCGRPFNLPLAQAHDTEFVISQDAYDGQPLTNPGLLSEPLQIRIGPSGIHIGDGTAANNLLNLLYDLADEFSNTAVAIVNTGTGQPIAPLVTTAANIKTALDKIRKQ